MTATNFCYWLQGYMELTSTTTITQEQLADIQAHLRITFKYDIDPSYGPVEHLVQLSKIHNTGTDTNTNC